MKITINNGTFDIKYNYTPEDSSVRTYSNGDPGEAPTPEEVDVYSMTYTMASERVYDVDVDMMPEWMVERIRERIEEVEG